MMWQLCGGRNIFLGRQSGITMDDSHLDIDLKALMDNDISGPALAGLRDKDLAAGIETGEGFVCK